MFMAASPLPRPAVARGACGRLRTAQLLVALACAGASGAAGKVALPPAGAPVSLDAASTEVDYKTNTVLFRDVIITQGEVRVSANQARASGLDFAHSRWTFDGNVRIRVDGGNLSSSAAVVTFANNKVARASITGAPAEFEQARKGTAEMARGHAGTIDYDVDSGTVRLTKDAWLTDGRNEITGQELVYNILEQRVQAHAAPGDSDRVRITIRPQSTAPASAEPVKP
jgi:lipopolysaccharide export system protein LptA